MVQQKGIKSLISNPLVQTFLIYVSSGWIVLEMTDYFIGNYGLGETFRDVLLIILLAGLPVALFFHGISAGINRRRMLTLKQSRIKKPLVYSM